MEAYTLVGFIFAVLLGICCFHCSAKDHEFLRRYENMLEEHKKNKTKDQANIT